MTTQMKIKTYLVAGIKAALLDTTGIKLASKSETTSHTYQHQALVDQLYELIANTDLNKLSYLNLDAFQKRDILAAHYIAKSAIRTKNLDQMTKAKHRLEVFTIQFLTLCIHKKINNSPINHVSVCDAKFPYKSLSYDYKRMKRLPIP